MVNGLPAISDPIRVEAEDLALEVVQEPVPIIRPSPEKFTIFEKVSAVFPAGQMTALLGSSGSGKTSLLNVLAGQIASNTTSVIRGKVTFNGNQITPQLRHYIAYVHQHDDLLPYLTVRETLRYAASLRLPLDMPTKQKYEIVEGVILELGLKDCANTLIGDQIRRGISGGQKRRVSIGVQLLTNPSVIMLDEPTTGLDAFTAFNLIQTLKHLSEKKRTLIFSIHQPRADIFALFDKMMLLSQGRTTYYGTTKDALVHFKQLGFSCPAYSNPADFLIDLVTIDRTQVDEEKKSRARIANFIETWEKKSLEKEQVSQSMELTGNVPIKQGGLAFHAKHVLNEFYQLTSRSIKNFLSDKVGTWGNLVESVLMGIVLGAIFYQLDENMVGIRTRPGAIYSLIGPQPYLVLILTVYRVCEDIRVFQRERRESMYGTLPYMFSNFFATFFPYSFSHWCLITIAYFMMGLRTGDHLIAYGINVVANIILYWCTTALAWACVSISQEFAISSLIANTFISFVTLTSGFYIALATIPAYIKWIQYVSPFYYAYRIMISAEFTDRKFPCPYPDDSAECKLYDGNNFLETQEVGRNDYLTPFLALFGLWLGLGLITYVLLRFRKPGMKMTRSDRSSEKKKTDGDSGKNMKQIEIELVSEKTQPKLYSVTAHHISLKLFKQKLFGSSETQILADVNAEFSVGKVSVILGGSGAGKSSFLNVLAGRVEAPLGQKMIVDGHISFTDTSTGKVFEFTRQELKSIVAYVTQFDDRLLPSLTVRETVQFAAELRLPSEMSRAMKKERAEKVILALGLKDCADTLIGNSLIKGVSGGEKRRVSIAIQLLMDPFVLLLDEPTSGLDAFSANQLMRLLKRVAQGKDTGKPCTVICTIHQPRSDIFHELDYIVLLAKGGYNVYAGSSGEMLSYLQKLGHECPQLTNPADFALDLSMVDIRSETMEEVSRVRVEKLITFFKQEAIYLKQPQTPAKHEVTMKKPNTLSFLRLISLLLRRSTINIFRQPTLVIARVAQVLAFGVVLTLCFARVDNSYESIQTRMGVLQETMALMFVGLLNNLAVYPQERNSFYLEHTEGVVSIEAFQLTYLIYELPFEILASFLYILFVFLIGGMQCTSTIFFVNSFVSLVMVNVGESLGIIFCTFFEHVGIAVTFTNLILALFSMMAGIFSPDMPDFLKYINYISPAPYAAKVLIQQEFRDLTFTCSPSQGVQYPNGTVDCFVSTGKDALKLYGFESDPENYINLLWLFFCFVGYRLVAYAILKLKLYRK